MRSTSPSKKEVYTNRSRSDVRPWYLSLSFILPPPDLSWGRLRLGHTTDCTYVRLIEPPVDRRCYWASAAFSIRVPKNANGNAIH